MDVLKIQGLSKYYGEVRGIDNLNLHVKDGAFFGFIGPNGAGKSTTIRVLLGLIKATSGQAQILGKDFVKDRVEIMKSTGYLPSEVQLYGQLSGRDLLEYTSGFYGRVDKDRIKALADWFEFDLSRPIEDLSFGNKKKIGIMQALIHRPKLLIMDEPTGGLDPLMQARFFDLLKEENARGTSIFFSSHTLSEVQRHCKEVAVIRSGKILEVSTVDKLREKQLKKVRMTLKDGLDFIKDLQIQMKDAGIYNLKAQKDTYTFDFDGEYQGLFKTLSSWPIKSFTMEEPALKEIFMHYYNHRAAEDKAESEVASRTEDKAEYSSTDKNNAEEKNNGIDKPVKKEGTGHES